MIRIADAAQVAINSDANVTYTALPSMDTFGSQILAILGTVFIIAFACLAVSAFIQKQWGGFIGSTAGAIVLAYILYVPDGAKNTLTEFAKSIFGG